MRPEVHRPDTVDGNAAVRHRLLIVDDVSDNRTLLTRRFERRGFEVIEADSGFAAIELIDKELFDLVLLDVMMPGIDGIETLKRIRGRKSASALPVIMVTAKTGSNDIVEALELGANDYVTKPVDFAVAFARVNTQISRKRAEQQVTVANEELRKANQDLERRVEERTSRLIDANQRLKVEIATREESQAKSQYLAYHDSLTGLGNRLLFKGQLEEALRDVSVTPHPLAVLFLDLDGFKAINDTLGHSIGDLLLKSVATRLRDIFSQQTASRDLVVMNLRFCRYRSPAGFVYRVGGKDYRDCRSTVQHRRSRCDGRGQRWDRSCASRRNEYRKLSKERGSRDV